jgi:hypothetical protein
MALVNPYRTREKLKESEANPLLKEVPRLETAEDHQIKPLVKYFRPSFAPHTNSWVVDIAFHEGSNTYGYLIFINENTHFVFAWPTTGKSKNDLTDAFANFLSHFGTTVVHIKGDGEGAFGAIERRMSRGQFDNTESQELLQLCGSPTYRKNVKWYLKDDSQAKHLTNSYVIIDAFIRHFRNLLQTPENFRNHNKFFQMLRVYNNTVHRAFDDLYTPKQVQEDPRLENAYIKYRQDQLEEVEEKQEEANLHVYTPGNILLVHIPFHKTKLMFRKQRRNFSTLATFVRYEGGNAVVKLFKQILPLASTTLVLPIFYTKFCAMDIGTLEEKYKVLL